ncbi:hypothetical protein MRB53_039074 [Persea americana]|nr:hypothetical protein MRB53_039074 [Persea americana]
MSKVFVKGATAVVTGASSGIGRAASETFAKLGMNVVMGDIDESKLREAAESFPDGGGQVITMKCDVGNAGHLTALKDTAYAEFGQVNVLMNNAGVSGERNQGSTSKFLDNWRHVFDVNFWGQRNGLEAFVEPMKEQKQAAVIINTGSKQGITNP